LRVIPVPHALPAVGRLLNQPGYARLGERYPHALLTAAIREQVAAERADGDVDDEARLALVEERLRAWTEPSLRRVINATGVVLHTNLGRAPLSRSAVAAVTQAASGYSNLELDLASGDRGDRSAHVTALLMRLTGAEAALAVNNNAGAVLLMLAALCRGREVIVSRGEQVEIGGGFRMPDVMRLSGARMVEVGTTNRTRLADYAEAVTDRTAALLRVHTSNFRVTGFTESAGSEELAGLARERGLLLLDDVGSGSLDGFRDEPGVRTAVEHADVVAFSGDKLLGGPQAGILVGRADPIRRLARHPLARALRIDKLSLAALEATLRDHLLGRQSEIPVARMLAMPPDELRRRAAWWVVKLGDRDVRAGLLEAEGAAGGGSLPGVAMPTTLVALEGPASRLLQRLRGGDPPVIARIEADRCCLDPRTVLIGEDETLFDAVERAVRTA
jgi:L-seryl-tRNA(Ser) seleniumtransferase